MGLVKWTDDLSVGVNEFDREHKELVGLLNELFDGMKKGQADNLLKPTLDKLVSYTVKHFAHEEKYFKLYNYPKMAEHIREHEAFKKEVGEFMKEFEEGKKMLSGHMLQFLSNWVTNHIKKQDKEYTKFLNEKGLV